MGIFDIFFKKKKVPQTTTGIVGPSRSLATYQAPITVHPDVQPLLWFSDGPQKNYYAHAKQTSHIYNGVRIAFSSFPTQEPSLISLRLPVRMDVNPKEIVRPPYFPSYADLSPEQRGVYWKFLADPYSGSFDIGYVFLFYYGLERHLLEGDYKRAFDVILKLRDVYSNNSFQNYSACASILTCLARQEPDLALRFYQSLDKTYEVNFSDNLYLLCKYGLSQPLTAQDLMRMCKTFEFSNQNYIKRYPDLFLEKLTVVMKKRLGQDTLPIDKYVTHTEWKKLRRQSIPVFANISIGQQSVDVPLLTECFKLKKAGYDILEEAHSEVKNAVADMRKTGTLPPDQKLQQQSKKSINVPCFDEAAEKELLKTYRASSKNALDRHFALIQLQNFYYRFRALDDKYVEQCIFYCKEDLNSLSSLQEAHIRDEQKRVEALKGVYSKAELAEQYSKIDPFNGIIPAFKRLQIIYEKQKDYAAAIDICNQAIDYYQKVGMYDSAKDFEIRLHKIEAKRNKST